MSSYSADADALGLSTSVLFSASSLHVLIKRLLRANEADQLVCSIQCYWLLEFGPSFRFHSLVLHAFEDVKLAMLYLTKIHQLAEKFLEKAVHSDLMRTAVFLFFLCFF